MNRILRTALLASLGVGLKRDPTGPIDGLPQNVSPDLSGRPADLRSGEARTLAGLTVQGVPPGHEHEPAEKQFKIVGGVCYVRQADYPPLMEALKRRRAARAAAEGQS